MADEIYRIGADLSGLEAALAEAVGSFEAMDEAALLAAGAVGAVERESGKVVKPLAKVGDTAKGTQTKTRALSETMRASGFGEWAEKIDHAGKALAGLGVAGGTAMAVVVLLTAAASAAVAAGAAIIGVVAASDEAAKRLEKLGLVTQAEADAVYRANDALAGIGVAVDEITFAMGTEFAPAVERAAVLTAAFGLATVDAFNHAGKATDVLRTTMIALVETMVGPFGDAVAALLTAQKAWRELTGQTTDGYEEAIALFDDLATTLVDSSVGAFEEVEFAMGDYVDQAKQVIERVGDLREAHEEAAKATKEHADAVDRLAAANEQAIVKATVEGNLAALKEYTEAQTEAAKLADEQRAGESEAIEALNEQHKAAATATIAERREMTATLLAGSEIAFGTISDLLANVEGAFESTKMASLAFFRAQQAAAIVQAVISTAQAIAKAIAIFGPPPSPPGIVAMAAAGAIGGAQIAAIAAQKPPSFHLGGTPVSALGSPSPSGYGAGDRLIRAQVGERVLTREQAAGSDEPLYMQMALVLDHRAFGAQVQQAIRLGGPLAALQSAPFRTGQRRYRYGTGRY